MSSIKFELLRSQARELEQGMTYIRKKVIEPSKFGFGNKSISTVRDVREEVNEISKIGSESVLLEEGNNAVIERTCRSVSSEINDMWTKLGELESEWKAFGCDYTPCPLTDNLVDDLSSSEGNSNGFESDEDFKPLKSSTNFLTPVSGLSMARLLPSSAQRNPSTPFTTTPRIRVSPFLTPPQAPMMSEITMEILGRSAKVDRYARKMLNYE